MNFKVKNKNSKLTVRVSFDSEEEIIQKEFGTLSRSLIRGFLKPDLRRKNQFEFSGPEGVCLSQRLKSPISKYEFFIIIMQLVEVMTKLQVNGLFPARLVKDIDYIFINDSTKELQFIYLPLSTYIHKADMLSVIKTVLLNSRPLPQHGTAHLADFDYFLNSLKTFDGARIENMVAKLDRNAYNTVKNQNRSSSGFITDKQSDYYKHYSAGSGVSSQQTNSGVAQAGQFGAVGYQQPAQQAGYQQPGQYSSYRQYEPVGANQQSSQVSGYWQNIGSAGNSAQAAGAGYHQSGQPGSFAQNQSGYNYSWGGSPSFGSASDKSEPDEEATGLIAEENEEATGLINEEAETGLLTESDETSLLNANVRYPTITRVLTDEKIIINKPVFRIGKEKSYVDFFIKDNNYISRSHADIVKKGNQFFVIDLNSKNRTYLNDQPIPPQVEIELHDGDRLKLANEDFFFSI